MSESHPQKKLKKKGNDSKEVTHIIKLKLSKLIRLY